ncbi:hypothetical protein RJ43_15955 [Alteromonas macleodii]|uniref:PEP-CTERM domain protein n=1 Tax=Alteromonas macleodii TaxID=28108 RepID=UPI00057F5DF0|nr:PEP-CTERM domain protein [Alteromonas macleodii]KHT49759.1 hypothetical protein RJ43_15955 [Alteromonas macleodii]
MANLIRKSIVAGLLLGTSSMASAATLSAGGVEWDTVNIAGVQGTTASIQFQQWFSNGSYSTGVDGQDTITASSKEALALGAGGFLTGVGVFTGFSDGRNAFSPTFCVNGPGQCELTIAFGGLLAVGTNDFDASNAWLNVYYDDTPDFGFSTTSNSHEKYAEAQNGTLWASFDFSQFSFDGNGFASGSTEAFLNIVGGLADVIEVFDNGTLNDIFFTASAQFNGDRYTNNSTGEITSVSTPATLGLFGLALFGLGVASRKRIAK